MKEIIKNRMFKNSEDLINLMKELNFNDFQIDESNCYDGNELNDILNINLDPNTLYISHIDSSNNLALITTDYYDDLSKRYRPILLVNYEYFEILIDFNK